MNNKPTRRIGMIVPSSNVTMETEIPALLYAHGAQQEVCYTFHSARMRMKRVTAEELLAMDREAAGCAGHLADAQCEVLAYACLVAVMVQGPNAHREVEKRLLAAAEDAGHRADIVTSAGALVEEMQASGFRKVSLIAPYAPTLTEVVKKYIEGAGIEVQHALSLDVTDNAAVGRLDPQNLIELARNQLDTRGVDAVVLSSCVQMPSLPALAKASKVLGLPCLSASSATVRNLLRKLNLKPEIDGFGTFLQPAVSSST